MDINDILNNLGLDLTNPEAKKGALEAIDAILKSRTPPESFGGGVGGGSHGGGTEEVEIDPDLIQPSQKHQPPDLDMSDIEVEDEEHILDQIKHNESDDDITDTSSQDSSQNDSNSEQTDGSDNTDSSSNTENTDETGNVDDGAKSSDDNATETGSDSETPENSGDNTKTGTEESQIEDETGSPEESESGESGDETLDDEETLASTDNDELIDDEDLLDDTLRDIYTDQDIKSKQNARKIKRERTLQAAKKALADAQTKKVAPALIRELEKSIEALEALTEAVTKKLNDISDDEFNLLINRVLDAIDAVGDSGLTYTSEEERALQAQEIKDDLASSQTQAELSAEDAAQIRAENQAVKAREKESEKYRSRSYDSFKGFQDFLNSLYRAVALQVHTEETQDDTWSAINRRHSSSGVLQPGKRIQELPNKKIPVIDFYFDCSGSWDSKDIAIGQKAVSKLADMEADGQIKINVYYFANNVYSDASSARAEGGTRAWNEIIKNIISTQATNVIIMTDADMEDWWDGPKALSYTVPGYVWYLWRNGVNAPRLPRDLKGRGGTQQFSFKRSDF